MRINHIGLSGGKDSTALLGWALHESGYPHESLRFSFCDTENEYEEVYDQIRKLNAIVVAAGCLPIRWLRANDPEWTWTQLPLFLALAVWKGRFPSAKARFCTQKLKIEPTIHYLEELWLEGHEVVAHSGVRASESFERSLMSEYGRDSLGCQIRRPLLKWAIADVWNAHRKYKLPINPLYLTGRKRVGCRLCVMSNKEDVRLTVRFRSWVIGIYREWELIVGASRVARGIHCDFSSWFHRKTVPKRFRTREITTRKGVAMMVATIDDVARWSETGKGAKLASKEAVERRLQIPNGGIQTALGFMFEEEDFNADDAALPCQSGHCE